METTVEFIIDEMFRFGDSDGWGFFGPNANYVSNIEGILCDFLMSEWGGTETYVNVSF